MAEAVNKKEVGERIRRIRLEMGYSMTEFAKAIDTKAKSGTVSNWETGKNLPNNERLSNIAFQGQMSVDELLHGRYCVWREELIDGKIYESAQCTDGYRPHIGSITLYGFKYCPYCGKSIKVIEAEYYREFTAEMIIDDCYTTVDITAEDVDLAYEQAREHFETEDDEIIKMIEHEPKRIIRRRFA